MLCVSPRSEKRKTGFTRRRARCGAARTAPRARAAGSTFSSSSVAPGLADELGRALGAEHPLGRRVLLQLGEVGRRSPQRARLRPRRRRGRGTTRPARRAVASSSSRSAPRCDPLHELLGLARRQPSWSTSLLGPLARGLAALGRLPRAAGARPPTARTPGRGRRCGRPRAASRAAPATRARAGARPVEPARRRPGRARSRPSSESSGPRSSSELAHRLLGEAPERDELAARADRRRERPERRRRRGRSPRTTAAPRDPSAARRRRRSFITSASRIR